MHTLMGLGNFILCMFSHQASLRVFGKEKPVFWRETSSRTYSVGAYFIAKDLAQIPSICAIPAAYLAMFYPITEPLIDCPDLYVTSLLVVFVSYGSGYLHSVALSYTTAQLATVVTSFGFLVLSGFTPSLATIWSSLPYVGWFLTAFSPIRWSFEAQLVTSFNQLPEIWRTCYADKFIYDAGYENNARPLSTQTRNCLILLGLGIALRGVALCALVYSARRHR